MSPEPKSARLQPTLTLALVGALMLAGCTTAMDVVGVPHAGLQPNGSYRPTEQEAGGSCGDLNGAVQARIAVIRSLADKAIVAEQNAPSTVAGVFGRAFGAKSGGNSAVKQYDEERARADALNKLLAAKGCGKVDIDAALANEIQMIEAARRR